MADEKDPIAEMLSIDDEQERGKPLQEAELNVDPPADKKEQERDESGKFKGKEEKAEEKPKEEKQAEKQEKPKETVPLAKYLEDKNTLKKQLEDRDITIKQFQDKLAALEAKLPKPEAPEEPDFVQDPKGYVDHQQKKVLDAIAEANKKTEAEGKAAQEAAAKANEAVQAQQFFQSLSAHEARFKEANPDYMEALAHLRGIRANQLRAFNPEITDQQIAQEINAEERNLAIQVYKQGRDPVQMAYQLAQAAGYKPKPKEEPKPEVKPEVKLPEAGSRRLPADQTLGAGGGHQDVYAEGETDPFDVAFASIKRRSA